MHNKYRYQEIDLDNCEPFGLNRQNSEAEWVKQMKRANEPQQDEPTFQPEVDEGLLNSNFRIGVSDPFKSSVVGFKKEKEAFVKVFNCTRFSEGITNFPSLSKFNSIINDELALDKRISMVDEGLPDLTVNRISETISDNLLQVPGLEKAKSALDDQLAPMLMRFKSNESYGILLTRNCSAYHVNENNSATGLYNRNLKYPHFGNLLDLLKKHFKGKSIDEKDLIISPHELDVLKSIITRKYKNKINVDVKCFFLKDKLSEIDQLDSFKRPEENYKFIFKRCIKYLKERLKAHDNNKLKRKEFDNHFYHYYFSEACEKYQISIDEIQNPCNSKGVKTKLKTVNTEYITNMTRSDKFMKDFEDYMYNKLQEDYEKTIDSKIDSLVKRWDELYSHTERKEQALEEIMDYVLKNKKCKLPWTGKEIKGAIKCVGHTFEECRNGKVGCSK